MGFFSFIANLFGGGESTEVKKTSKAEKSKAEVEQAAPEPEVEEESPWWENPVLKNEEAEFEAVTNTILFDELSHSLKEHRLEIIEIPDNIAAILDIINRKNFKYNEITNLVEQSPVLTGDFLSIANSAAFSRGIKIKELSQALPRLGRQTVQSILFLNASKMSVPENPIFAKVAEEIVIESQAVARICRYLGERYYADANEAFLAGLLHNIGKLGLLKQISKHYDVPEDLAMEYHQSLFRNIFPIFYQEAGKVIGNYWKLDDNIINSISLHNRLDQAVSKGIEGNELKLCALVNFAEKLARIMGFGDSLVGYEIFNSDASEILKFEDTPANRDLLKKMFDDLVEVEEDEAA